MLTAFGFQQKKAAFEQDLPRGNALLLTFITTYGVADNEYKVQLADNELRMDALFEQV